MTDFESANCLGGGIFGLASVNIDWDSSVDLKQIDRYSPAKWVYYEQAKIAIWDIV